MRQMACKRVQSQSCLNFAERSRHCERIVGDVQPCALLQEEGVTHSLVRAFAVNLGCGATVDGYDPDVSSGFAFLARGDEDEIKSIHSV